MQRIKDLTGKIFGQLTVLHQVPAPAHRKDQNSAFFLCQCKCGGKVISRGAQLVAGSPISCGCVGKKVFIDLSGKQFGELFVLHRVPPPATRQDKTSAYFLCKCSCNKEIVVKGSVLTRGQIRSCDCLRRFAISEEVKITTLEKCFNKYKDGDITKEYFSLLIQLPCFYCGIMPQNKINKHIYNKKSSQYALDNGWIIVNELDRLNSDLSHSCDNVVPCCHSCNAFKLNRTYEETINHFLRYQDSFNIQTSENLNMVQSQIALFNAGKLVPIPSNNKNIISILYPERYPSKNKKRESLLMLLIRKWRLRKNRKNADRKNSPLTDIDLAELMLAPCCYCGIEVDLINGIFHQIDRLDNSLGYTKDNSVSACKHCNSAKHTLLFEDFSKWHQNMLNHRHLIPETINEVKEMINARYFENQIKQLNILNYYQIVKEYNEKINR